MDVGMDADTGDTDIGDMVVVPFAGTGAIKAGIKAGIYADTWVGRGRYYADYYKNTGKKPRYYNKLTRRRIKW